MAHIARLEDIGRDNPPWTVDGVCSGLTLIWGRAGVGKSFVAMSIAASVAAARPWMGRHTRQGQVVYVAGEGGLSNVGHRLRSALYKWHIEGVDEIVREGIDLSVVTPGVDLVSNPDHMFALLAKHTNLELLVIDTLSRCMVGDENKQEIMGKFVHTLDELRDLHGCSVIVVHHANRQDEIRGSSVLFGAADVSWHLTKVEGGATHLLRADKLRERDAANGLVRMRLLAVPIVGWDGGKVYDELGDIQNTLIVKPTRDEIAQVETVAKAGRTLLSTRATLAYASWRDSTGLDKTKFDTALSYILSYPGMWGITRGRGVGVYVLAKEE